MHVKRNDSVIVIRGNHRGEKGRVKGFTDDRGRVFVSGLNLRKKHVRPSKDHPQGGRIEIEGSLAISAVAAFCAKCEKPARLRVKPMEDGKKIRTCAKCGADFGEKY